MSPDSSKAAASDDAADPVDTTDIAETAEAETVDFTFTLAEREVAFVIDEDVYALDAIYGASYLFIDRCYVFLARPADRKVSVRLRTKEKASEEALEALAGELANELLNQMLRLRLSRSTMTIREQYMAKAFFAKPANNTIAELLAELDEEELEEDDLEIPVPWDNKQPKQEDPTDTSEATDV